MTYLDLLHDLIARARAAGADAADAVLIAGTSLSVQSRLGKTEHIERSEGRDLGLRVFVARKAAIVSSTAIDPAGFTLLAERAVAMARVVPDDPYSGLADTAAPPEPVALDLDDPAEPDARGAGRPRRRGRGRGAGRPRRHQLGRRRRRLRPDEALLVTSAGFAGRAVRTSHSVSATALAGTGTGMQRDYDYHSTVHLADLDNPEKIGRSAGERAIARLNPARPKTAKLPVVYDPRVAGSLLGHLAGAINGACDRPRHLVPEGQAGPARLRPGHDDPRRSASAARPALARLRRRRHPDRAARADRGRRADHLAARQPLGPPAWPDLDRARRTRHRRSAVAVGRPISIWPLARSRRRS